MVCTIAFTTVNLLNPNRLNNNNGLSINTNFIVDYIILSYEEKMRFKVSTNEYLYHRIYEQKVNINKNESDIKSRKKKSKKTRKNRTKTKSSIGSKSNKISLIEDTDEEMEILMKPKIASKN